LCSPLTDPPSLPTFVDLVPVSLSGIPTDEEQATGLERRALSILEPNKTHIIPGISDKRLVGCLCTYHTFVRHELPH
uniref:Uncharacterized protein n=1 Tax=Oncorhynchus mykiss TaxID=8022 RepID=A0A8C7UD32_ONCMY